MINGAPTHINGNRLPNIAYEATIARTRMYYNLDVLLYRGIIDGMYTLECARAAARKLPMPPEPIDTLPHPPWFISLMSEYFTKDRLTILIKTKGKVEFIALWRKHQSQKLGQRRFQNQNVIPTFENQIVRHMGPPDEDINTGNDDELCSVYSSSYSEDSGAVASPESDIIVHAGAFVRNTIFKHRVKNVTVTTTYYEPTVSANLAAPTTLVTPNTLALWPQGDQSSATNTIKFLEDNWKYLVSTETQDQYEDQYEQYSQDKHLEEEYHQQNKNQHEYTAQYTVQEINAHTTNKTKISSTHHYITSDDRVGNVRSGMNTITTMVVP